MMCRPCEKALRKPGRHRAHDCDGGGTTGNLGWFCECPRCFGDIVHRIEQAGGFPAMALDALE